MTGSGKTSFISRASGRNDLNIGHNLVSCTQDVQIIEGRIDDRVVHYIDSPGFSDTYLSDTEVLEMIADYLSVAYSGGIKLTGIIYLHPISDRRVTQHSIKNLEMFKKLCGENNLQNVVLATTFWDRVGDVEGGRREVELRENFWSLLLALGAKTARHYGTRQSAVDIVSTLLGNKPFYVQLQEEMGRGHKSLKDTSAGQEVMLELQRIKEKHERELADMREVMKVHNEEENKAAQAALEDHYKKMLKDMERTLADEKRMNAEAVRSLQDRIDALEKQGRGPCTVM